VLDHRDQKERTDASNFCAGDCHRVSFNCVRMLVGEIGDMHHLFRSGNPHDGSVLAYVATALSELGISLWHTE